MKFADSRARVAALEAAKAADEAEEKEEREFYVTSLRQLNTHGTLHKRLGRLLNRPMGSQG